MNEIDFSLQRELNTCIDKGIKSAFLRIGGIRHVPADGKKCECWECHWSLPLLYPTEGKVLGVDPLDALLNCLQQRLSQLKCQNRQ